CALRRGDPEPDGRTAPEPEQDHSDGHARSSCGPAGPAHPAPRQRTARRSRGLFSEESGELDTGKRARWQSGHERSEGRATFVVGSKRIALWDTSFLSKN